MIKWYDSEVVTQVDIVRTVNIWERTQYNTVMIETR